MFTVRTALEGFIAPADFSIITPLAQLVGLVPFDPTPAPQSIFQVASLSFFRTQSLRSTGGTARASGGGRRNEKGAFPAFGMPIATARKTAALAAAFRAEAPDRNAHLAGFIGEVGRDARARKRDQAGRKRFEHLVVALERRGLGVPVPIGFEHDLRHLAVIGPAGGCAFGAARRPAMKQHHVGMLGVDTVERFPDAAVIVAVGAAREGNARPGGNQQLRLGTAAGGDEFPAVDHRRGQRLMVDH